MKFLMNQKTEMALKKCISILLIITFLAIFLYWQNNDIIITEIEYKNSGIPEEFNGFRIAHISDLHNKSFGKRNKHLISRVVEANPDIIIVTGDLIDKRKTDVDIAADFIRRALEIAPLYYVSGNHERISGRYDELKGKMLSAGAVVLDNDVATVMKNNEYINIIGLKDVGFYAHEFVDEQGYRDTLKNNLKTLMDFSGGFSVVLSHRPEFINEYAQCRLNLVFCGHAHGGQIRLPFVGGLVAPGQGIFPKYTSGKYEVEETTMVVSRGLGNSIFPFRVFNRPEIVVVTLSSGL